jgi:hypothetical protein
MAITLSTIASHSHLDLPLLIAVAVAIAVIITLVGASNRPFREGID